ncbi:MAG: hypothetical protein QXP77_02720 [Candidatus Aenigmatarchaeota archaeon]
MGNRLKNLEERSEKLISAISKERTSRSKDDMTEEIIPEIKIRGSSKIKEKDSFVDFLIIIKLNFIFP